MASFAAAVTGEDARAVREYVITLAIEAKAAQDARDAATAARAAAAAQEADAHTQ
jgi:hypothetical protein